MTKLKWYLHGTHASKIDYTHMLFHKEDQFHFSGYVKYKNKG